MRNRALIGCALVLAAFPLASHSQNIISTVAGGGTPAAAALNADIAAPSSVVEDAQGNIYVSALDDSYIYKIDTSQNVTVFAGVGWEGFGGGGGQATKAVLGSPTGLAFDHQGNLLIADFSSNHIWKVNVSTDILTNVAGTATMANPSGGYGGDNGPATKAQLNGPWDLAVAANGEIYIADTTNQRVRVIKAGTIFTLAGNGTACANPTSPCGDGGPATSANLSLPSGVSVDSHGNVYISDTGDNRIRRVDRTGTITTVVGTGAFCATAHCGDGGLATKATLNFPAKVFVDSSNDLYIVDEFDERIRLVSASTHRISTVAGNGHFGFSGDGKAATSAALGDPVGVFVDASGNILIADQLNNRIREVAATIIHTIAGGGSGGDGGGATEAVLSFPSDLALDAAGNQFILDDDNNRVRRVDAVTKEITTVAGNGVEGYTGDGGPAIKAAMEFPYGIAIDGAGDIFVADTFNNAIRLVQNGTMTTYAGTGIPCPSATDSCGDGGPATQANLSNPRGVAVDGQGNVQQPQENPPLPDGSTGYDAIGVTVR